MHAALLSDHAVAKQPTGIYRASLGLYEREEMGVNKLTPVKLMMSCCVDEQVRAQIDTSAC